jgi:beta-phosphoglucomutase-like phosphatase (HAD superfamily)
VIEDSTYGVTAGHRAGMTVAAIKDERFHFDQSLADYSIDGLRGIFDLLGLIMT